ncbi:TolC family protein [Halosquirtibacter xylanolyticus]|uniref:TolC family protein n=1 Tax=Halosquirtibacter xylanolyticus TaxID=3374599 RepID=UPI003747EF74|nr:TolC family protein [Prolixibacteraceae bacterium]
MKHWVLIVCGFFLFYGAAHAQNSLDYYLQEAMINSPVLEGYRSGNRQNELRVKSVYALYRKPKIGLQGNIVAAPVLAMEGGKTSLSFSPSNNNYWGFDTAVTDGVSYQSLVSISQPLLNSKKLGIEIDGINNQTDINNQNITLSSHDLKKLVVDAYLFAYMHQQRSDHLDGILRLLRSNKAVLERLSQQSLCKPSDISRLAIESTTIKEQQELERGLYYNSLTQLRMLCGIMDSSKVVLTVPLMHKSEFEGLTQFTHLYDLQIRSLEIQKQKMKLPYMPQLNLNASMGLNGIYGRSIYKNVGMDFGVTLSWNIFDGKQLKYHQRTVDIQEDMVGFEKRSFMVQHMNHIVQVNGDLTSCNRRIGLLENQLIEYGDLMNVYQHELAIGSRTVMEYILLLREMASLQVKLSDLMVERKQLINTYNYWNW